MEIIGRLVADAKATELKDGRKVVNFSMAINDGYKVKGGEIAKKITTYVNCAYWLTASIATHLTKGSLVELYGRMGVNTWTNAEGEAKGSLTFHVNNIKLHGKLRPGAGTTPVTEKEAEIVTDDLPF